MRYHQCSLKFHQNWHQGISKYNGNGISLYNTDAWCVLCNRYYRHTYSGKQDRKMWLLPFFTWIVRHLRSFYIFYDRTAYNSVNWMWTIWLYLCSCNANIIYYHAKIINNVFFKQISENFDMRKITRILTLF